MSYIMVRVDENIHTSVLLEELVAWLNISQVQKNIIIDCTLGLGWHGSKLLSLMQQGDIFIGLDADKRNLEIAQKRLNAVDSQAEIILIESNFRYLWDELRKRNITHCTSIYYDLWVSSLHFDEAERGFSLRLEWPLDMRFDISRGRTARDVLNYAEEKDIFYILKTYGEEPYARKIAAKVIEARKKKKFETTFDLTEFLETNINKHIKTKMRVFQALRIAVNEELTALEESLEQACTLLQTWGIIAAISFHSLEDRIVKHFYKKKSRENGYNEVDRNYDQEKELKILTKKPLLPSEKEQKNNSRSRSAKLRIAQKI